jgi:hypothetical protein
MDMVERGFALVDTPWFFDDDLLLRLQRRSRSLSFHDQRWWKFPQLARYGCWLERVLGEILPEGPISLSALEYRHEPAGAENIEVDHLHADRGYIRTVCTLSGLSTIYRPAKIERPVPDGQTLVMTAQDRTRALRVPCTLHRRPGPGPERAVIVGTFAPRQEQPHQANVYREVARSERPRRRG